MATSGIDRLSEDLLGGGPLMDRAAAARLMGVSPRTVYRLIHNGELPAYRVGHQLRVARADLRRWLEDHAVGGEAA